ncbi:MAG: hypothetical protein EB127_06845 [Alphaproteobacteria bacterium]|nr:hypothetical protein [Alphaproteobacteria bacterium]
MKKLLFILLSCIIGPVYAQDYTPGPYVPPPQETSNLIYSTVNPPPEGTQYQWSGFIPLNTGGGGLQGGNIPAYNSNTGTFVFGYMQGNINYNLFSSPEWPKNNGFDISGFKYSFEYFNQDFSRGTLSVGLGIYATDNSLIAYYGDSLGRTTNGWTNIDGTYAFSHPYDAPDIGRIQFTISGRDDRFWAGYWGPQIRDFSLSLLYDTPGPPPPSYNFWTNLAGEWGTFTLTETTTVRYGGEGSYIYATLQAGTYACNNFEWGRDPAGGIGKSCEAGTDIDPNSPTLNCETDPTNPQCIINAYTDPNTIADDIVDDIVADVIDNTDETPAGSDDGSDDGTEVIEEEEETVVADEATDESDIEELLQDDDMVDEEEETVVTETTSVAQETASATYRELTDEEKAQILADSISKNTLEFALSVAENATNTSTSNATEVALSTSSSKSLVNVSEDTDDNKDNDKEDKEEIVADNSADNATELLETGRTMGATALAQTQQQSEQSASESVSQAESIAIDSSSLQKLVDNVREDSVRNVSEELSTNSVIETITVDNSVSISSEIVESTVVAQNTDTVIETTEEKQTDESTVTEASIANNIIENTTTTTETVDSFSDIMNIDIKVNEVSNDDLEFVQALLAQQEQKKDDDTNNTFSDDEKVTIQNDPNLSNAFNVIPNTNNLEILGVLSNKQEEKSDAEKRADQAVAANKEQQEEINKNYMDADQSGIVAAMSGDTDVSSYRRAMLNDNNIWYKPEDIYKNVVYKDNVRGMYFLEKGNTDTYKKMVDEQYK